jgi:V8-like Glu-specific endopeptidase
MNKLTTIFAITAALGSLSLTGCKDKPDQAGSSATSGAKGGGGNYTALTADAAPAAITPADKPPFESVVFQKTGKRGKTGWPLYNAYNLNTKAITFMAITVYGYDKDGKQVVRSSPPLSWNGSIKPGEKTDWEIDVGSFGDPVTAAATEFQICFTGISLDGGEATNDAARCPDERPKS